MLLKKDREGNFMNGAIGGGAFFAPPSFFSIKSLFVLSLCFLLSIEAHGVDSSLGSGLPTASSTSSTSAPVSGADGAADPQQECSAMPGKARTATSGMDMASYALVGETVNSSVQTLAGSSAKIAHQGNAAINSVLSAVALKRCTACKSAISECESKCEFETACAEPKASLEACRNSPSVDCSIQETDVEDCRTTAQENLEECQTQEEPCSQVCLQAGISGIQAATSLLAAKALGDCQPGEDCDSKKEEKEKKEKEKEKIAPPDMSGGNQMPGFGFNELSNKASQSLEKGKTPPPLSPQVPYGERESSKIQMGKGQAGESSESTKNLLSEQQPVEADERESYAPSLIGGNTGKSSSKRSLSGLAGTPGAGFSYDTSPNSFGGRGGGESGDGLEGGQGYGSYTSYAGGSGAGGSDSFASGGGAGGGGYNRPSSSRGMYSSGSVGSLAQNLRGTIQKKDVFARMDRKPENSIFLKMSKFIKKVCFKRGPKCQ